MLADFFGNLERLAADLYPYRLPIGAVILIVIAAVAYYAYHRGLHVWAWQRRLRVAIIGIPVLVLLGISRLGPGFSAVHQRHRGGGVPIRVRRGSSGGHDHGRHRNGDVDRLEDGHASGCEEPMPEMLGGASTFQGSHSRRRRSSRQPPCRRPPRRSRRRNRTPPLPLSPPSSSPESSWTPTPCTRAAARR